jgi:hypothetical protein
MVLLVLDLDALTVLALMSLDRTAVMATTGLRPRIAGQSHPQRTRLAAGNPRTHAHTVTHLTGRTAGRLLGWEVRRGSADLSRGTASEATDLTGTFAGAGVAVQDQAGAAGQNAGAFAREQAVLTVHRAVARDVAAGVAADLAAPGLPGQTGDRTELRRDADLADGAADGAALDRAAGAVEQTTPRNRAHGASGAAGAAAAEPGGVATRANVVVGVEASGAAAAALERTVGHAHAGAVAAVVSGTAAVMGGAGSPPSAERSEEAGRPGEQPPAADGSSQTASEIIEIGSVHVHPAETKQRLQISGGHAHSGTP